MADVQTDDIVIKLNRTEAIDVGNALKERLVRTASGGYDVEKNYRGMTRLCIQLLTVAYGSDWSEQVNAEIAEAHQTQKGQSGE